MTSNAQSVKRYYENNKDVVFFRKAMKRCRESGSVPTVKSILKHNVPLVALLVAFGDWAASTGDEELVKMQLRKLRLVRRKLGPFHSAIRAQGRGLARFDKIS